MKKEIAERKQSEENLPVNQDQLQNIFNNTTDMIFIIDLKTKKITYANHQVTKTLEYSPQEILSMTFNDLHPDEIPRAEKFFQSVIENKSSMTDELHCRKKCGSYINAEIFATLAKDVEVPFITAFVRDISDRKKKNTQREAYRKNLEKSNEDLEAFAYLASHDLQSPLRKIISFGDLLKELLPDEDAKANDYLNRMQIAAGRMQNYIQDLLNFSKAASKETVKEHIDLKILIETVLEDLELEIVSKKAAIQIGDMPVLELDSFQFQQVFQNLISNAIKYQPPGQAPNISIKSSFSENNRKWEIHVEDNGIGIDENNYSRIFRPFERLHGLNEYKGTGIGLAICEKVVARHNGEILVKSVLGKGTTFIISLPEKSVPEE